MIDPDEWHDDRIKGRETPPDGDTYRWIHDHTRSRWLQKRQPFDTCPHCGNQQFTVYRRVERRGAGFFLSLLTNREGEKVLVYKEQCDNCNYIGHNWEEER